VDDKHWAHTRLDEATGRLEPHGLADHLEAVATKAALHAKNMGAEWALLAGLWHDLGKYRKGFQHYIRQEPDAHIEGKLPSTSDKTHSAAGALHALKAFELLAGPQGAKAARPLAYVIAGHHAGLADWTAGLDDRLLGTRAPHSQREYDEALAECTAANPAILDLPAGFNLHRAFESIPGIRSSSPLACALWVRMLFSALVDADFLDTEAFMDGTKAQARTGFAPLLQYQEQLDAHLDAKTAEVAAQGRADDPVMLARASVLRQCRDKAALPPGVFTLNVPTGGGKTLSSLAFALRHATSHDRRRVIYAIPYTSIIEQTADVFGAIFGRDAIVEHHSQADADDRRDTARSRLACENWDAPLVVTTNVQLFESLFAARTSRCRKLHNIAGSVIVLDEAQLLPPPFLQPILDTLNLLVAHYGVSLLLCTATQPTLTDMRRFDPRQSLRGLPKPTPIIDDEATLFQTLDRVRIEWPADLMTAAPTDELTARLAQHDCVLAIVNTRNDAAEIVAALDAATGDTTLHLSAAMCGQHRADVIRQIREQLAERRAGRNVHPLRVVSTQLVEAGVDIDFPVVWRALAGLDSIAQAAGRCNREGRLAGGEKGRVVVFVRDVPRPLQAVRAGVQATRSTLADQRPNALEPHAFEHYFPLYYEGFKSRDERGIVELLRNNADLSFSFRTAASVFRLVDDEDQCCVIVPYISTAEDARPVAPLIERLRRGDTDRWLMRALQRYTVTARCKQVAAWQARGDVQEIQPGLFLLLDELLYDQRLGLLPDGQYVDAAGLVL
jgi:CRISPR-associated endonuclease/helicase Cas3